MQLGLQTLSFLALLLSFTLPVIAQNEEEPESGDGKKAPIKPVAASTEGQEALALFRKPEGWSAALFAAEPELANPVAMFVDNRGRVFVCESFRQDRGVTDNRGHDKKWLMADLAANSVQDRIAYHHKLLGNKAAEYTLHDDRIRMLVDTNNDGLADQQTIFADGFNQLEDGTGAGVLVRGNTAYFTCIPKLWELTDSDDDGVAEKRQALYDGFGVRVAFRGHDMHGLIIGPDGRLYFSLGDRGYNVMANDVHHFDPESGAVFRCELDGKNLEVVATGLRNPQELAFDDYGFLFTGDNNSDSGDKARWVNVMVGGDSGWRMMYQYLPDRGPFNREKIWQPFSADTPAYIVPPIENIGDGPAGLTCYPGTGLQGDYANCFFMVDFRGGASNSGIRLIRTQPSGAFWKVERSEQPVWNILATDVDFGPDGALWVCDWVNGWVGEGKGRVYRFFDVAASEQSIVKEVQSLLAAGFSKLTADRLGQLLAHVDRRIRLEAQWELATRRDVKHFAQTLAQNNAPPMARLHSVWGLGQVARQNVEHRLAVGAELGKALKDLNPQIQRAAATALADADIDSFQDQIVELIEHREPSVQFAAAMAAGKLKVSKAIDPICKMLAASAESDPGLRHAGIMALSGPSNLDAVVALKDHVSVWVRIAAVVALRKRADVRIAEFLSDKDSRVRTEAARAINDVVKLHEALPQLARLIDQPIDNDALAHRVLNANFRLGNPTAIAVYASRISASDAMRIEALDMLGNWESPGELDRVMNRYLPLAVRDPAPAKVALKAELANILLGSSEVQTKALEVASKLGITGLADVLKDYATNKTNSLPLRQQAMTSLASIDAAAAKPLVVESLSDPAAAIRATGLMLSVKLEGNKAIPAIEKAINSDDSTERQAAWDALAKVDDPQATKLIEAGLQQYIAGSLSSDVWLNVIEAAEGRVSKESIKLLNDFEKQIREGEDALAEYRDCLQGGDPEAGKKLFFTKTELSCVRCHKVAQTGGEVGPNLTEIGKQKDHRYMLEAIVNPDAKIAENYETIQLLTEDDQIFTGILRKESTKEIQLMDSEGKLITVDSETVVTRKKGKSSMPADLIKFLSRRELRNLVSYLASLKGE